MDPKRSLQDRDRLVLENLPLVPYVWRRSRRLLRYHRSEEDDIMAAGYLGLIRAASSFDESRGWQFSTLACACIWRAMRDEARRWSKTRPQESLDTLRALGLGHDPLVEADPVSDPWLAAVAARLKPGDRELIRLRFYEGLTLGEIGEKKGLSKERIRQLLLVALTKLRKLLKEGQS